MQYTKLGTTGLKVSRLGFGCMRLPMGDDEKVNREKAIPMLHKAFDLGINFFDTAVFYCHGDSERVVGEAFEDRREDVILSTKNHHYDKKDTAGWRKHLDNSLRKLRTDYIDIYNHHGLNYNKYEDNVAGEEGLYQQMRKAKEEGLIRHICFSFHGSNDHLVKLVDTGLYDTVILQYNLLDRHLEDGIAYAAENGMGVIVMGPVGGGRLGFPSEKAASLVGDVKSTPELALRFVLSNMNVSVALSGMSDINMVEENVATVSGADELTEADFEQIKEAIEERKKLSGLYCTGCNYCMPCPAGVDIPENFKTLNLERVFGLTEHARNKYEQLDGKAALCKLCGKCMEPCPQDIDIPKRLAEAVETLDSRAGCVMGWTELTGGRCEEGIAHLSLRYHLKNFTDEQRDVRVEFQPHAEEQIYPESVEVDAISAYGRRSLDVEVSVPRNSQSYSVDASVSSRDEHLQQSLTDVIAIADQISDCVPLETARKGNIIHVPNAFHPVHNADNDLDGRSFDFSVSVDSDNLYVCIDCDDDLTGETHGGERCHRMRIYLDGRDTKDIGRGGYGRGVAHVTLTPSPEGGVDVQTSNDAAVEAACEISPTGYRLDATLPWEDFVLEDGMPDVVGFNIRMSSTRPTDDEVMHMNWTGRGKPDRDTSGFGKIVVCSG